MKTIQEIYNGDLYQAIREFLGQVKFPEAPVKPRSPQGGTSSDYAEYAKEQLIYEIQDFMKSDKVGWCIL